jgi:hypothetical protein
MTARDRTLAWSIFRCGAARTQSEEIVDCRFQIEGRRVTIGLKPGNLKDHSIFQSSDLKSSI